MTTKAKKECKHCWHYTGGITNGMGSGGVDDFQCCWCGLTRRRGWMGVADPKHGQFQHERVKRYDDE